MRKTNEELAAAIRMMTRGDVLPAGASSDLKEYQKRSAEVNRRLSIALGWLRLGLLSEAIAYATDYPDALDAAWELDPGRDALEKLMGMCQSQGIEYPSGVDQSAAWELSNAFILKEAAPGETSVWDAIDAYRAVCMLSLTPWDRLEALRAACVAASRDKAPFGAIGDAIERSLLQQTGPLIQTCMNELAELARRSADAGPQVGASGQRINDDVPGRPSRQEEAARKFSKHYKVLVKIIESLNESQSKLVLEVKASPEMAALARRVDELRLRGSLERLARLCTLLTPDLPTDDPARRAAIDDMRKNLRSIDDVIARKLADLSRLRGFTLPEPLFGCPPGTPLDVPDLEKIVDMSRRAVREHNELHSDIRSAHRRLWELVEQGECTIQDLETAYRNAMRTGLTIPDNLNDAYHKRRDALRRAIRRRRVRSGVIAACVAVLIAIGGLGGYLAHRHGQQINRVASAIGERLRAGEVPEADAIVSLYRDQFEDAGEEVTSAAVFEELASTSGGQRVIKQYNAAVDAREKYDTAALKFFPKGTAIGTLLDARSRDETMLAPGVGRTTKDNEAAEQLLRTADADRPAERLDGARLGLAEWLVSTVKKRTSAIASASVLAQQRADEIESALPPTTGPTDHARLARSVEQFAAQMDTWRSELPTQLDSDRANALSAATAERLVKRYEELAQRQGELTRRSDVYSAVADPRAGLGELIRSFSAYIDRKNAGQDQKLADAIRELLRHGETLESVSSFFDPFLSVPSIPFPPARENAASWSTAFDTRFVGLCDGVSPDEMIELRSYLAASADPNLRAKNRRAELIALFRLPAWSLLHAVADVNGVTHYGLGAALTDNKLGHFTIPRWIASNASFESASGPTARSPMLRLSDGASETPVVMTDLGLGGIAEEIATIIERADLGLTDPLTANLHAAQRVVGATMPSPLKARLLTALLSCESDARDGCWPRFRAEAQMSAWRRVADGPWSPTPKDHPGVREEQIGFEKELRALGDLAGFASERERAISVIAERAMAHRLIGLAWRDAPGGAILNRLPAGLRPTPGAVFVIAGTPERPALLPVGRIDIEGTVLFDRGDAHPADGTPLFARTGPPAP